jgi:uncharacterized protein YbjT (DUF2867 family)
MNTQSSHASPILVIGAAGAVGSIGRNRTEMLLAKGHKVRALVRGEDGRAAALRELGAQVMQGDLTDLIAMHGAMEGCASVYFGRLPDGGGQHRCRDAALRRRSLRKHVSDDRYADEHHRRSSTPPRRPGNESYDNHVVCGGSRF